MGTVWKQERPTWCKHKDCLFKKRHQDRMCGGCLPEEIDYETFRFCLRFEDGEIIDIKCNASDLDYFRSIFDALDGKKTSWLS